jgi:hypothetical protein
MPALTLEKTGDHSRDDGDRHAEQQNDGNRTNEDVDGLKHGLFLLHIGRDRGI